MFLGLVDRLRAQLRVVRHGGAAGGDSSSAPPPSQLLALVPWTWICEAVLRLLRLYPTGLCDATLLTELQNRWDDEALQWLGTSSSVRTTTIDFLLSKPQSVVSSEVLEVTVQGAFMIPNTHTQIVVVGDAKSSRTIEMYLHHRFLFHSDFFASGRVLRLTSFQLTSSSRGASSGTARSRILPCDLMIPVLTESELSTMTFSPLKDISAPGPDDPQPEHRFLVQVLHIAKPTTSLWREHLEVVYVSVRDSSITHNVMLALWDEQIPMTSLFGKGDFLLVSYPFLRHHSSDCPLALEIGSRTFVALATGCTGPSATPVFTPNDMSHFADRICGKDLKAGLSNISLFGRIVKMLPNEPLVRGSRSSARFGVRLALDEDLESRTTVDITFWRDAGLRFAINRVGHMVLITGIYTSPPKPPRNNFFFNTSDSTAFFNASVSPGVLTSPVFGECRSVASVCAGLTPSQSGTYLCAAVVADARVLHSSPVKYAHRACQRELESVDGMPTCGFCLVAVDPPQQTRIFCLEIVLSDTNSSSVCMDGARAETSAARMAGTSQPVELAQIVCECTTEAAQTLLAISPVDFERAPSEMQQMCLRSPLGAHIRCLLTRIGASGRETRALWRIEQLALSAVVSP
eukprot:gnl/Spiro4/486_TR269_c0_g1_i1.p1 gnl/Spiro4/486_TR269_c0_g1~~gnl/Spiro4/486_TR269_c0_g1_i1.p1  ORF type:complete len:631 (-),score=68.03 gnl/Spiro4/486_TR269_c0_g1_i1:109-2001(-)